MRKILLLAFLAIAFNSCTDVEGTTKVLKVNNYTPIDVGGYAWFSAGESDHFATSFTAVAPNGDTVSGCVTRGWFKGGTIRLD